MLNEDIEIKESIVIKFNNKKKLKYEVWDGETRYDSFVSEETAKDMCKALSYVNEVFMKNMYEKYVLSVNNPSMGCIHQ